MQRGQGGVLRRHFAHAVMEQWPLAELPHPLCESVMILALVHVPKPAMKFHVRSVRHRAEHTLRCCIVDTAPWAQLYVIYVTLRCTTSLLSLLSRITLWPLTFPQLFLCLCPSLYLCPTFWPHSYQIAAFFPSPCASR